MAHASERLNADIVSSVLDAAGGQPIVVALGGGADSAVLLGAAVEGAGEKQSAASVRAVFVRHGLPTSDLLEKAAIDVAARLGVALGVLDAPVPDGPDLESRARHARYSVIEADLGPEEVAMTGHTSDDQAETVVMRLARGSGSGGLAGIPADRGPWRRPLLTFSKAQLLAEATALDLPHADDPSNIDPRFTRSRIRHAVMPVLEDELPGSVRDGLARSARLLGEDDAYLDDLAQAIPVATGKGWVRIATAPLATSDRAVASRAVRTALRYVLDGYPGEESDVEAVLNVASEASSRPVSGGMLAVNEGPWVRIGVGTSPNPSVVVADEGRFMWEGVAYTVRSAAQRPVLTGGRFTLLSAGAVSPPLEFRGAQEGDTIATGEGNTPVTEILRAHGVHADQRRISLVAVNGGKIAAVVGVRTASWAAPLAGEATIMIEREVTT